ncbi:MAG: NAD-dependent epimerase/dehydratase family protein [Flavobacteriales bacterium]|nr:NAD-dependent epimerase/dehydratase family protein [Flavobacteriales bacterium]
MLLAVTGGGGFIAGRFMDRVQEMSAAGGALRIRALASSEASHGRMATMGASIEARIMARDLAGLREQLRGVHVLLHAGWSTVPATADRDPLADVHVNAAGSLLLFQAAIAEGVRRIVFISSGGEGREARTWADLDAERDYLHIDDLVDAVLLAVAAPVAHTVMNVGSGRGTTLHELAALVARISGQPFNVTGAFAAPGAIRRNVLDGSRLRKSHGWVPKVSLEEGMQRVCHALLQNASR